MFFHIKLIERKFERSCDFTMGTPRMFTGVRVSRKTTYKEDIQKNM
jgi:hypothetical protein